MCLKLPRRSVSRFLSGFSTVARVLKTFTVESAELESIRETFEELAEQSESYHVNAPLVGGFSVPSAMKKGIDKVSSLLFRTARMVYDRIQNVFIKHLGLQSDAELADRMFETFDLNNDGIRPRYSLFFEVFGKGGWVCGLCVGFIKGVCTGCA